MNRRIFMALASAALLAACESTPNVASDTTPGANLAAYKTYSWASANGPADMSPVAFERIRQAVDGAMAAKGYSKADPGEISLIVTVGARDMTDIQTWGRFGQQTDVYNYTEGKLSIDLFDTKTRQALWHGQATQNITRGSTNPALIDAAVAGIMARLPGRA